MFHKYELREISLKNFCAQAANDAHLMAFMTAINQHSTRMVQVNDAI